MALYHFTMKSDRKPNGDKIMADEHADYNGRTGKYQNLADNENSSLDAAAHSGYINRDDGFAEKGCCVYKAHHLPKWANESPKEFFAAAAAYEESEHTYKEFEFALQNELTFKQNLEIIQSFVEKNFSDYYYAYAIHTKEAALGEGIKNPHCHFMFSMRQMDELEKEQERAPECFFKKARRIYAKKDGSVTDNRRLGGCKVPERWNKYFASSAHLRYLREDFAHATNRVLEKYHITARVDHRSNQDRLEEALRENDEFRAQLYALPPEQHLGPAVAMHPDDPRVIALREQRKLRYETIRMIEGITRLEHLADDHQAMKKQKKLTAATAEIHAATHEIPIEEALLSNSEAEQLAQNSAAAQRETDKLFSDSLSFADAIQKTRHARMTPLEIAEETKLHEICQEYAALKKEYGDLEAREEKLRAVKIAAMAKKLPGYNVLTDIENAGSDKKPEQLEHSLSPEELQTALADNAAYAAVKAAKAETAVKLQDHKQYLETQTNRIREINARLNLPENKQIIQAEALRLLAENRSRRDAFQDASLREISLLKQEIHALGAQMAVLQEDVILYREAIEEAKETVLKELKATAEMQLPELEEKIADAKKRIAEKENAAFNPSAPEPPLPTPEVNKNQVILTLPAGYDKNQCRIWVTKVERTDKKTLYKNKTENGAWIGAYSGRKPETPGQFYVQQPEDNAIYAVWKKDTESGKKEMIAKAKFINSKMQPLPLPEQARLLYLESEKRKLVQEKEFLNIFQQYKAASMESFELKKQLQATERKKRKAGGPNELLSLDLPECELSEKLAEKNEEIKNLRSKMPEIRKLFADEKVKSTLTQMANKITLGNVPQKKKVEELQKTMTETIERIRSVLAARIRLANEQAIADRLHDQLHNTQEIQRRKAKRRYTAMEIRRTIYDILAAVRAEKQTLDRELVPLEDRFISAPRARKMAVDVYTKNQTKDLRELNRGIEKKKIRLQKAKDILLKKQYTLLHLQKPKWYENAIRNSASQQYAAANQEIQEEKYKIAAEKAALYSLQVKAAQTETTLNELLKTPGTNEKIEKISQGILKKNQPIANKVVALRAKRTQLMKQETEFLQLASATTRQIAADRGKKIVYAPAGGKIPKNKFALAALIAKAFEDGNTSASVIRINEDDNSILDWEGKEDAKRKATRREAAWSRDEF